MTEINPRPSWPRRLLYPATILLTALLTFGLAALLMNISERKREAGSDFVQLVALDESITDPAVWGKNFPHQYDGYKRTAEMVGDRHGHNESFSKLEKDPVLVRMFAGYAFGVD